MQLLPVFPLKSRSNIQGLRFRATAGVMYKILLHGIFHLVSLPNNLDNIWPHAISLRSQRFNVYHNILVIDTFTALAMQLSPLRAKLLQPTASKTGIQPADEKVGKCMTPKLPRSCYKKALASP